MTLRAFPLLALAVILYNVVTILFGMPLQGGLLTATLPSSAVWTLTVADLLLILALGLLFRELLISSSTRSGSVLNHGLSMVVVVICVIEFLLVSACGTSTFLMILLFAVLDVVAGFSVSIVAARRDLSVERV